MVLQNVTIWGTWTKCTRNLFLITVGGSTMISIKKFNEQKVDLDRNNK